MLHLLLPIAQAADEWAASINTAVDTGQTEIITLVGTYILPVMVVLAAGFFAIRYAIGKIFGRRR